MPLGAVLRLAHGDEVPALETPGLDGLEQTGPLDHHAVHPGPDRRQPLAIDPDVGGKVRRREKPLGKDPVRWKRREASIGRARKRRLGEIG